jgi:putative FmdB family regulatory protein
VPIYEFRCLECSHLFEKLFVDSDAKADVGCPECRSASFERVISRTNYAIGSGKGTAKPKITTKSCGPGNSCVSLEIPGPSK